MPRRGNGGGPWARRIIAGVALTILCGCSRKDAASAPLPPPAPSEIQVRAGSVRVVPPVEMPLRADVPQIFRVESDPTLPAAGACEWSFESGGKTIVVPGRGPSLEHSFEAAGRFAVRVRIGAAVSNPVEVTAYRVALLDADGKPVREARLATLAADAFDPQGRFREELASVAPERLRLRVEDPAGGPSGPVTLVSRPPAGGVPPVTRSLPLSGPPEKRLSLPFILTRDREDAGAAGEAAVLAWPGGRLELSYRGHPAGSFRVGPSVLHEIPLRFFAVGPAPDLERAVDLRLSRMNEVWEPFGRRFTRGEIRRIDAVRGLLLIRGRASGVDAQGRPSRAGFGVGGREISVPTAWRDDGAPVTPKSVARALIAKEGGALRIDVFENVLAGDREAVVLRVRRPDGSEVDVKKLAGGADVAQAAIPLSTDPPAECEVSGSTAQLSLDELALLASGRSGSSEGYDIYVLGGLRSLQSRPAFKVYRDPAFPASIGRAALVSWPLMDGSGRFPYGLSRVVGELLLPGEAVPAPGDTLFADPLSELPGVAAHKRLTPATGALLTERGRGVSGRK